MQDAYAAVNGKPGRKHRRAAFPGVETMEARRLLSVSPAAPLAEVKVAQAAASTTVNLAPAFTETTPGVTLAYSATSDDPALVAATVSGSTLSLTYDPAHSGITRITATATEPGGASASQLFRVRITPSSTTDVTVGANGVLLVHFSISADATHRAGYGALWLSGAGSAVVHFAGAVLPQNFGNSIRVSGNGNIAGITITGSTAATQLSIVASNVRPIELGDVTADGTLGRLIARNVTLLGDLKVKGGIGQMALGSAVQDRITFGSDPAAAGQVYVAKLDNAAITAGSTLNVLQASAMQGVTVNITGNLGALSFTPPAAPAAAAPAAVSGLNLNATGVIRSIKVGGDLVNSVIRAGSNIHLFSALSMIGSQVYAGIGTLAAGQTLPATTDLVAATLIGQVVLKGHGVVPAFSNSVIAVYRIGYASIRTIAGANNGVPFGLAAQRITSVAGTLDGRPFRLSRVTPGIDTRSRLLAQGVTPGDFVVNVL